MSRYIAGGKRWLPWWLRLFAKMVLARIPTGYRVWQRIGLFRHGRMDEAAYALAVFESHLRSAGLRYEDLRGKLIVEMGCGDSVATALIAHAAGARALLVDTGPYANMEPRTYEPLCAMLRAKGLAPVDALAIESPEELLTSCGAFYYTDGAEAWKRIPSGTVDFLFSHAVLEHVELRRFRYVQEQCFRVMRKGAVASHNVDLRDHLGGALNNLRFSASTWESRLFVNSGFYTNRIRMGEMLGIFSSVGFDVSVTGTSRWNALPTPRNSMGREFSGLPEDELLVSGFDVVLCRGCSAADAM